MAVRVLDTTDWNVWLTDDRLSRMNHYRFRANVPDLTREEAILVIQRMSPPTRYELMELIG